MRHCCDGFKLRVEVICSKSYPWDYDDVIVVIAALKFKDFTFYGCTKAKTSQSLYGLQSCRRIMIQYSMYLLMESCKGLTSY